MAGFVRGCERAWGRRLPAGTANAAVTVVAARCPNSRRVIFVNVVVQGLALRGLQPQLANLRVLFSRNQDLGLWIVRQPGFEKCQHLFGSLPRCTHDENVAEALLVAPVPLEKADKNIFCSARNARLLAFRESAGRCKLAPQRFAIAYARMMSERFDPVFTIESEPFGPCGGAGSLPRPEGTVPSMRPIHREDPQQACNR